MSKHCACLLARHPLVDEGDPVRRVCFPAPATLLSCFFRLFLGSWMLFVASSLVCSALLSLVVFVCFDGTSFLRLYLPWLSCMFHACCSACFLVCACRCLLFGLVLLCYCPSLWQSVPSVDFCCNGGICCGSYCIGAFL